MKNTGQIINNPVQNSCHIFSVYTLLEEISKTGGAKICSNVTVKLVAEGFGQLSYMENFKRWKLSDRIGKSYIYCLIDNLTEQILHITKPYIS